MNPISVKIDSGEEVCIATDVVNSCRIDKVKSIMNDKKTLYRNSAKLKSHIHSQIQDLIETLKERERQLFLEIDEHELDCSISIADQLSDVLLDTNKLSFDDKDTKMCSASLQKKLLKFVGNPEILKAQLQQFGKLEETGETANESSECIQQNSPKVKKLQLTVNGLMRRFSRKNGVKRMHRESSGSSESFEVIDGLDDEEYQKYFSSFKNEDDIEVVSNPDEFQPWQPSFPVGETGLFWNDTEPKQLNSPIPHVQEASKKDQQSTQSPDDMEVSDPVMRINKQLQSLLQPMTDSKSKAQTSQLEVPANNTSSSAFPLEQGVKSNGLSSQPSKTTPVPSAIMKLSLNKYLDQEDTRKWLVSSDNGLNGKNRGLDSLVSNFKGLHFKMC